MIVTASIGAAHKDAANHLAAAIGLSLHDMRTYKEPDYQDGQGNLYVYTSFGMVADWQTKATGPLSRPIFDQDETIDLTAASDVQARMQFWIPDDAGELHMVTAGYPLGDPETTFTGASPDILTVIGGMPGLDALARMGLTPIKTEDI